MTSRARRSKRIMPLLAAAVVLAAGNTWGDITGSGDVSPEDPATWTITTESLIGNIYDGTVEVNNESIIHNGNTLYSASCCLGYWGGTTGLMTVNGTSATWSDSGDLTVGNLGLGILNIIEGGQVTVEARTYVANGLFNGAGLIDFGAHGGTLTTHTLYAGLNQINGTGSIYTRGLVSDGNLVFDATQGLSQTLNWINGNSQNVTLHLNMTDSGLDGGDLGAGYTGTGTLTITDGVAVTSGEGYLGRRYGSMGAAYVTGTGSVWTNNSLFVSYFGTGILNITNGGRVNSTSTFGSYIGYGVGPVGTSTGTVTVDGVGSIWATSGNLSIGGSFSGGSGTGSMYITNGGMVNNTGSSYGASLGYYQGSMGTVAVEDTGSTWNDGFIMVGESGVGALSITAGGQVNTYTSNLGRNDGAMGTVIVSGTGSTWNVNADLYIGNAGAGTLTITNGGQVNCTSTSGSYIGYDIYSTGTVAVDGTGSTWSIMGDLHVGVGGAGTLTISNGGKVTVAGPTSVAIYEGATGSIDFGTHGGTLTTPMLYAGRYQLSGTGSIYTCGLISESDLVFDATHGLNQTLTWVDAGLNLTIHLDMTGAIGTMHDLGAGYLGAGTLTIQDGVAVTSANGYMGYKTGSSGIATVSGSGSTWTNSYGLFVGYSGAGALHITNGGMVNSSGGTYSGNIGYNVGATGTVYVDGPGSTWTTNYGLYIGHFGTGALTITNGGQATSGSSDLGYGIEATGTVIVDGTGSTWASGSLTAGNSGVGALTITNGGQANSGVSNLGYGSSATGTVTVDGFGSKWTSDYLNVGCFGTGTLHIIRGGEARSVYDSNIGANPGATGTVIVDGTGSAWIIDGSFLYAGNYGTAMLSITNGASASSYTSYLGFNDGATGMATVDGAGSSWTVNFGDGLYVGYSGAGMLHITNSGSVTVAGATYVAYNDTATGLINFGSAGGMLTTQSLYAAPGQFTGTGTINCRGLVSDITLVFDHTHGLSQSLNWISSSQNVAINLNLTGSSGAVGDLGAGYQGSGTLTIQDGVVVTSTNGYLGYKTGSTGLATVSGTGSTWTNSGHFDVGFSGAGALAIINGGTFSSGPVNIGSGNYATGTGIVDGSGSAWSSVSLNVGLQGNGNLNITNGGKVTTSYGILGFMRGSTGTVNVDGTGSMWSSTVYLCIGNLGNGTLNITDGGNVSDGAGYISLSSFSPGTVSVDGAGSTWTNNSTLSIGTGAVYITNGGQVTANGVSISGNSLVAMTVGDGSVLNAGTGSLANAGVIRLKAIPGLAAGTYTPLSANNWSGAGTTQALGGRWRGTSHTFIVTAAANGTVGQAVTINRFQNQRIFVTDPGGESVEAGFQATTGTSNLTLSATLLTQAQAALLQSDLAAGAAVVSGWTFTTSGYTTGDPVFLSLGIGSGYAARNLAIWHYDGAVWAPFATGDLSYDGMYADFTVTGFSGYGVAAPIMATSISAGTVSLNANNMLPKITDLTVNGGTLDLNGFNQRLNSLSDGGVSTGLVTNSSLTASTLTMSPAVSTSTTFSGVISGNLALTMASAGTLILTGNNNYSGGTTISAGVLQVGNNGTTGSLGTGAVANVSELRFNRSNAITVNNAITGTGTLTHAGTGTTTISGAANYSGPTVISAGTLVFGGGVSHSIGGVSGAGTLQEDAGSTLTSDAVNLLNGTWAINGTHVLRTSAPGGAYGNYTAGHSATILTGTSAVGSGLTFGILGNLDIRNNGVIVEATPANKAALITQVAAAITGGKITSSTAITNSHYAVVLADNGVLGATFFGGVAVDTHSLLVTQALKGDGNLDGLVNAADLLNWKINIGHIGNNTVSNGDYNNDGNVNAADLLIWKLNLGVTTGAGAPSSTASGGLTTLGGTGLTSGTSSQVVPEPASLMLLGLSAAGLLRRRCRRLSCARSS